MLIHSTIIHFSKLQQVVKLVAEDVHKNQSGFLKALNPLIYFTSLYEAHFQMMESTGEELLLWPYWLVQCECRHLHACLLDKHLIRVGND